MRYKELKVLAIPKWGNYLRNQWRETFAGHLSAEEQEEIYMGNFLWNLCSWGKVNCLEGDAAITTFNNQLKNKCTIFYQYIDETYLILDAKTLKMMDFPMNRNII